MLLAALSALVCTACVVASLWRLECAVAPIALQADLVAKAVGSRPVLPSLERLCEATRGVPALSWEHALFAAFSERNADVRDALVREQLTEYDAKADRYLRAPRVCASVCTTAGFFFASIVVLQTAGMPMGSGADPFLRGPLLAAIDALAFGIAGMALCASVQVRARRMTSTRRQALQHLIRQLEAVAEPLEPA